MSDGVLLLVLQRLQQLPLGGLQGRDDLGVRRATRAYVGHVGVEHLRLAVERQEGFEELAEERRGVVPDGGAVPVQPLEHTDALRVTGAQVLEGGGVGQRALVQLLHERLHEGGGGERAQVEGEELKPAIANSHGVRRLHERQQGGDDVPALEELRVQLHDARQTLESEEERVVVGALEHVQQELDQLLHLAVTPQPLTYLLRVVERHEEKQVVVESGETRLDLECVGGLGVQVKRQISCLHVTCTHRVHVVDEQLVLPRLFSLNGVVQEGSKKR